MFSAAASYSLDGGWNTALAAGSVVLLTGGAIAMIKKALRPVQAIQILVTALVVGAIALFATGFPSGLITGGIIATTVIGGIAIAAAVVTRPNTRRF